MGQNAETRAFVDKAIRLILVFALVFGLSFHLENAFAYPADTVTPNNGSTTDPDAPLTDLVIYQWDEKEHLWFPVPGASAVTEAAAPPLTLKESAGMRDFVAVPVWDNVYLQADERGGVTHVESAVFADWELASGGEAVNFSVGPSKVLSLSVNEGGPATVTCRARGLTVSFAVDAVADVEQPPEPVVNPELKSVEILFDAKPDHVTETGLVFAKDDIGKTLQLQAKVAMQNVEAGDVYDSRNDGMLSEFSGGALGNLKWTVLDGDAVSVDEETGLLTVLREGTCRVLCEAQVISTSETMADEISVIVGNPEEETEDPQGPSHPQDMLTIVSNGSIKPASDDADSGDGEGNGEDAGAGAGDAGGAGTGASGSDSSGATTPDDSGATGDEPAADDGILRRAYSLSELEALGAAGTLDFSTQDFTMRSNGEGLDITGYGFSFLKLLEHAFTEGGVELSEAPIESIDLIDYRGIHTKLDWEMLQGVSAMLAVKSALIVPGDEPGEGESEGGSGAGEGSGSEGSASGEASDPAGEGGSSGSASTPSEPELVDNTRFRLLFNSNASNVDANALRWINTIQVNMKTSQTDELQVGVSYVPVPLGVEAEFVASPNHNINGSWDCQWEKSTDGGATWQKIKNAIGQTLRVLTSHETVGTFYRVTIDNKASFGSGASDEHLTATSEPVELRIGDDFSVVLSYNPPRAGEVAIFRSSIYGYSNVAELDYIWEYSEDGGGSWTVIENEHKSTLKVKTEPVNNGGSGGSGDSGGSGGSGGDGEGSTPNLIYIRVRAITPDDVVRVSNAQPLTVHVGDADTDTGGDDDNGRVDGDDLPIGGNDKPSGGGSSGGIGNQVVRPIDSFVIEGVDEPMEALDPNGSAAAPAASVDIYLSDDVTQQVAEQNEALEEQMAATTPGARWTKLKSINPTSDDVRRVLESNPLAPYVLPSTLGFLFAGALEKLVAFRRQL